MDQRFPQRRRAQAVAISQSVEARRKAMMATVMMIVAGMTLAVEALMVAERIWGVSHP